MGSEMCIRDSNTSICTIDSFCGSVVREYFHILGVQKDFRLADENEIKVIGSEALESVLEDFYRENISDFTALVDAFANKNGDDNLRAAVLKISDFLATQPFGDKWLDDMLLNYSPEIPVEQSLFVRAGSHLESERSTVHDVILRDVSFGIGFPV